MRKWMAGGLAGVLSLAAVGCALRPAYSEPGLSTNDIVVYPASGRLAWILINTGEGVRLSLGVPETDMGVVDFECFRGQTKLLVTPDLGAKGVKNGQRAKLTISSKAGRRSYPGIGHYSEMTDEVSISGNVPIEDLKALTTNVQSLTFEIPGARTLVSLAGFQPAAARFYQACSAPAGVAAAPAAQPGPPPPSQATPVGSHAFQWSPSQGSTIWATYVTLSQKCPPGVNSQLDVLAEYRRRGLNFHDYRPDGKYGMAVVALLTKAESWIQEVGLESACRDMRLSLKEYWPEAL